MLVLTARPAPVRDMKSEGKNTPCTGIWGLDCWSGGTLQVNTGSGCLDSSGVVICAAGIPRDLQWTLGTIEFVNKSQQILSLLANFTLQSKEKTRPHLGHPAGWWQRQKSNFPAPKPSLPAPKPSSPESKSWTSASPSQPS